MSRSALLPLPVRLALLGCAFGLTACGVGSVRPLHADGELTFDPQLVGTWIDTSSAESAVLTANDEGGYHLLYREGGKKGELFVPGKSGQFTARLGSIGTRVVLDLQPDSVAAGLSDVYRSLLLPTHGFVFLERRGMELRIAILDGDTLRKYLRSAPKAVPHVIVDDFVLITGSTPEVRRFFTRYLNRPNVFGETSVWRRQSP
jgi:hypothetical protein